jgi:hypothetical protein
MINATSGQTTPTAPNKATPTTKDHFVVGIASSECEATPANLARIKSSRELLRDKAHSDAAPVMTRAPSDAAPVMTRAPACATSKRARLACGGG